jgi:hypothetical protein
MITSVFWLPKLLVESKPKSRRCTMSSPNTWVGTGVGVYIGVGVSVGVGVGVLVSVAVAVGVGFGALVSEAVAVGAGVIVPADMSVGDGCAATSVEVASAIFVAVEPGDTLAVTVGLGLVSGEEARLGVGLGSTAVTVELGSDVASGVASFEGSFARTVGRGVRVGDGVNVDEGLGVEPGRAGEPPPTIVGGSAGSDMQPDNAPANKAHKEKMSSTFRWKEGRSARERFRTQLRVKIVSFICPHRM